MALGARVTDAAELARFDGVVVATGVVPRVIDLPGAELPHVVSYAELLLDGGRERVAGETVAIIGAGGIGVDVAHMLSDRGGGDPRAAFYESYGLWPVPGGAGPLVSPGHTGGAGPLVSPGHTGGAGPVVSPERTGGAGQLMSPERTGRAGRGPLLGVTLMRRGSRVGERIGPSTRWAVLQALRKAGVEILTGIRYERIDVGAVAIEDSTGRERLIPADTVVIAAGQEPDASLAALLGRSGRPHIVIGGAAGATELDAERAFREGAQAPVALARVMAR